MFTRAVRLGLAVLFCIGIGIGWASPSWADPVVWHAGTTGADYTNAWALGPIVTPPDGALPYCGCYDVDGHNASQWVILAVGHTPDAGGYTYAEDAWSGSGPAQVVYFADNCPNDCYTDGPHVEDFTAWLASGWAAPSLPVEYVVSSGGGSGDSPGDAAALILSGLVSLPGILLMLAATFILPAVFVYGVKRGWPLLRGFF
jgi:hypothetical protein